MFYVTKESLTICDGPQSEVSHKTMCDFFIPV